ncbi:hypothetical protein N784_07180 [Pontibacillus litoralis JSM 072002]|uniref:Flagellar protein FlbD n=1 Tax=Pontibacillus litoralis JSM 072002 TaxID=1385512 RepID=A0A0A5G5P6_9BACI|nr:hypothetical protein N784_07180 [Pontibacillus litoralis JSM 072002]
MNGFYIEQVQSLPDTTITLLSGKKLLVQENEEDVVNAVQHFYRRVGLVAMTQLSTRGEGEAF